MASPPAPGGVAAPLVSDSMTATTELPSEARPRNRAMRWIAGTILVFFLIAAIAWAFLVSEREQTARLSDGSTVTLKAVSFGAEHWAPGRSWERLLGLLPKRLARRLGLPNASVTTTEPQLVVWFEASDGAAARDEVAFADETGYEVRISTRYFSSPTRAGRKLVGFGGPAFPRRDRHVRVAYYRAADGLDSKREAEFLIRNPVYRDYPSWQAEPMPITRRSDGIEFTLTRLATGAEQNASSAAAAQPEQPWTRAHFRILERGKLSANWKVEKIEMWDATGNHLTSSMWSNLHEAGEEILQYRWSLWPSESAWKIRAEFSRKPESPFSPEDTWTIRGIRIPEATSFTEVNLKTNLHEATLHFVGLSGAHGRLPGAGGISGSGGSLEVNVAGDVKGYRLSVVSVTDNLGQPLQSKGASWSEREFAFNFEWPTNAQTIDVTLAWHKSYFVEYMVEPQHLTATNTANPRPTVLPAARAQ